MTRDESIRRAAEEIYESFCGGHHQSARIGIVAILSRHWPRESWPRCPKCDAEINAEWSVNWNQYYIDCLTHNCDATTAKGNTKSAALRAFRAQNGECNG